MLTVKQHERLIDRIAELSELELSSVLKDIADHLRRNKLDHLVDEAFQMDDQSEEIEGLQDELQEAECEKEKLEDKLLDIFHTCTGVEDIEEFENDAFDQLKTAIKEIKSISE